MSDIAEITLREYFIDLGYVVTDYERCEIAEPYLPIVTDFADKCRELTDTVSGRRTYEQSDSFVIERTSPDTLQNVLTGLVQYYIDMGYEQRESPMEPTITAHLIFIKNSYRGASITLTLRPYDGIIITENLIYKPVDLGIRSN